MVGAAAVGGGDFYTHLWVDEMQPLVAMVTECPILYCPVTNKLLLCRH